MPISSLLSTARRACIKNVRSITDVGAAPYELLRPVLLKLENPEQLRRIEIQSPQICGEDREIWLHFMERDVPNYRDHLDEPTDPQQWYECYLRLVRDNEARVKDDAKFLKDTIDGINDQKAKHKLQRVDLDFVSLPEGVKRDAPIIRLQNKIKFIDRGAQHGYQPSQREIKINRGEIDPNAPRRIAEPKGKLNQWRRDVKAMGIFQHQKPKQPTGIITPREMARKQKPTATTIVNAPRSLIEEHRAASAPKPIDPTTRTTPVTAPIKRRIEHDVDEGSKDSIIEERENRLKAFTNPSNKSRAAPSIRPPRPHTSSPAASSSPSSKPPSAALKHTAAAGSAFGQIGKRNIEVLTKQKKQDVANQSLRADEHKKSGLIRVGKRESTVKPIVGKAASAKLPTSITPSISPPSKVRTSEPKAPTDRDSRAVTSSQGSNSGTAPPIMKKKRAAVDVFMPPKKKLQRS